MRRQRLFSTLKNSKKINSSILINAPIFPLLSFRFIKKLILYLLFIISTSSILQADEPKKKIDLIWHYARLWEEDWILELFSDFEVNNIIDVECKTFIDGAVIITGNANEEYFSELKNRNYSFGLIHISDETYSYNTNFYKDAKFVFRNYWHKKFLNQKNVHFFALGYKKDFWKNISNPAFNDSENRPYVWSFAGTIVQHSTREKMIANMKKIPNFYIHETFFFGDPSGLSTSDYRELLLQSIFIPCPTGYWNLDSFRVYEALECGCIPIVEKVPLDYFSLFFPDCPFIKIQSWEDAPDVVNNLLADPEGLERLRRQCQEWWSNYKKELKREITSTIKNDLLSVPEDLDDLEQQKRLFLKWLQNYIEKKK